MTAVSSSQLVSGLAMAVQPSAPRIADGAASTLAADGVVETDHTTSKPGVNASATTQAKAPASKVSKEELSREIQALQAKMDKINPSLAFVLDHDSGRELIQLTDRVTKEVVQQYPTQATLQISKALDQFQKGQLLSKMA